MDNDISDGRSARAIFCLIDRVGANHGDLNKYIYLHECSSSLSLNCKS